MRFLVLALIAICFSRSADANLCPFCTAVKQTLRQEIETMDAVAIGKLIGSNNTEEMIQGQGEFRIVSLIKGDQLVSDQKSIVAPYFGGSESERNYLLMGVDPNELLWSSPLPISEAAEKYLLQLGSLPEDPVKRLRFFMDYLEHPDRLLAGDAYDEFALAPYDLVKKLKDELDHDQLVAWVQDDTLSPERKRLYFTLLGICGTADDAAMLGERLRSGDAEKKAGLDAMIACYVTLLGKDALPLIEDEFLINVRSSYGDTYAAVMALRFHGTEGGVVEREDIVKSMHHLLERPQLADLVIPDLARWSDWSQIERMVELFKESTDDYAYVRVPVINYLRACPDPAAKEALAELEKIDPKSVQRAKTFFPIPRLKPTDTSFNVIPRGLYPEFRRETALASRLPLNAFQVTGATVPSVNLVNRWFMAGVNVVFCLAISVAMWLILTTKSALTELVPAKAERYSKALTGDESNRL